MFEIDDKKTIHLTRGNIASINVTAKDGENNYVFKVGDVIRLNVLEKKKCDSCVLTKQMIVEEEGTTAVLQLTSEDTRIGAVISKPIDYWYELELNPDTNAQTIIGYDMDGEKIFRLYPEGVCCNDK